MKRSCSLILYLLLSLLPLRPKIYIYNNFLGAKIHKSARIGLSFIKAKNIKIGKNVRINHFNIIRNLEELTLDDGANIGKFVHVSAVPITSLHHLKRSKKRHPALIMRKHACIVGKHYFDCNDTIEIGEYSTIAGLGCSFFTHGINVKKNCQETRPISIGKYCLVGANCVFVKGSKLPDYSILGANSTLHKSHNQTHTLYSGVPAIPIKTIDISAEYFSREKGFVD